MYFYTEVDFKNYPESRVDGLLLVVKGGIIKDAAMFEMKKGASDIDRNQIEKYIKLGKECSIPKLITISNQFVSEPTQSVVNVRTPKGMSTFHFSWSYILTWAHILLHDNETNISDEDQVEIMSEIVHYFENEKSGVCGFNYMKPGWKNVVEKIHLGKQLKKTDEDLEEAVLSWQQEEKDMALQLSKRVGLMVETGKSRYKGNLQLRWEDDKKDLIGKQQLSSTLKVRGAVSDIFVTSFFKERKVEMDVLLSAPRDRKAKSCITWIKKQMELCQKKQEPIFSKIKDEILVEVIFKNKSKTERRKIANIDELAGELGGRDIKGFKIMFIKDFEKDFDSKHKFVRKIEEMLLDYYRGVVQYLKRWEATAPKIAAREERGPDIVQRSQEVAPEGSEEGKKSVEEEPSDKKIIPNDSQKDPTPTQNTPETEPQPANPSE